MTKGQNLSYIKVSQTKSHKQSETVFQLSLSFDCVLHFALRLLKPIISSRILKGFEYIQPPNSKAQECNKHSEQSKANHLKDHDDHKD